VVLISTERGIPPTAYVFPRQRLYGHRFLGRRFDRGDIADGAKLAHVMRRTEELGDPEFPYWTVTVNPVGGLGAVEDPPMAVKAMPLIIIPGC
jgi:hypothetical protein